MLTFSSNMVTSSCCFGEDGTDLLVSACRTCTTLISFLREGTFLIGWGVGRGILEIFGQKSRDPPTSQIGLMYDPS